MILPHMRTTQFIGFSTMFAPFKRSELYVHRIIYCRVCFIEPHHYVPWPRKKPLTTVVFCQHKSLLSRKKSHDESTAEWSLVRVILLSSKGRAPYCVVSCRSVYTHLFCWFFLNMIHFHWKDLSKDVSETDWTAEIVAAKQNIFHHGTTKLTFKWWFRFYEMVNIHFEVLDKVIKHNHH